MEKCLACNGMGLKGPGHPHTCEVCGGVGTTDTLTKSTTTDTTPEIAQDIETQSLAGQ